MDFAFKSLGLLTILCIFSSVYGIIYIDNLVYDSDNSVVICNISYTHDASGNSATTCICRTLVTISKMLLYFKVVIAEDVNNQGLGRQLVNTVIDLSKLFQGLQANPFMKGFFRFLIQSSNFTMKVPFPPVSCKIG